MKAEGRSPRLFGGWLPGYRCRMLEPQNFARRTSNSELRSFSLNRSCDSDSSFDIPCSTFYGSAPRAVSLYPVISVPRPMSPVCPRSSTFGLWPTPLPPNTRRIIDQEIAWAAGCVIRIGICGGGRSGLHLAGIDRASSMQFAHQAGCRGSAVAAAIAVATCDATRAGGHQEAG